MIVWIAFATLQYSQKESHLLFPLPRLWITTEKIRKTDYCDVHHLLYSRCSDPKVGNHYSVSREGSHQRSSQKQQRWNYWEPTIRNLCHHASGVQQPSVTFAPHPPLQNPERSCHAHAPAQAGWITQVVKGIYTAQTQTA